MTNSVSSGPVEVSSITETINAVKEAQRIASEKAMEATSAAAESFQSKEASLISQIEAYASQLSELHIGLEAVGIEEFLIPDLGCIDYLFKKSRRSNPKSKGRNTSSKNSVVRESKPCLLSDAILMSMNQVEHGTEFGVSDISSAVQSDPVNYPFSGSENSTYASVAQNLTMLVKEKSLKRVGRGVYALTSKGSKAADAAFANLEADTTTEAAD